MQHRKTTATTEAHEYRVSRDELLRMLARNGVEALVGLPQKGMGAIEILDANTGIPLDEGLVVKWSTTLTSNGSAQDVPVFDPADPSQ